MGQWTPPKDLLDVPQEESVWKPPNDLIAQPNTIPEVMVQPEGEIEPRRTLEEELIPAKKVEVKPDLRSSPEEVIAMRKKLGYGRQDEQIFDSDKFAQGIDRFTTGASNFFGKQDWMPDWLKKQGAEFAAIPAEGLKLIASALSDPTAAATSTTVLRSLSNQGIKKPAALNKVANNVIKTPSGQTTISGAPQNIVDNIYGKQGAAPSAVVPPITQTARMRFDELKSKGADNLTSKELREVTRLDAQLKKVNRLTNPPADEVPIDLTSKAAPPPKPKVTSDFGKDSPAGRYIAALKSGAITKETSIEDFLKSESASAKSLDPNLNQGMGDPELAGSFVPPRTDIPIVETPSRITPDEVLRESQSKTSLSAAKRLRDELEKMPESVPNHPNHAVWAKRHDAVDDIINQKDSGFLDVPPNQTSKFKIVDDIDSSQGMKQVGQGTTSKETSIRQLDEDPRITQMKLSEEEVERLLGVMQGNLKSLPSRGHYVDDPNFLTGSLKRLSSGSDDVIPPIKLQEGALERVGKGTSEEIGLPNQNDLMKNRIEEELSKFESTNVSKSGLRKPGDDKIVVIPETGMTQQDIDDLRSIRKNQAREDAMPKGGRFTDKFLKAFPQYEGQFSHVSGWNEGVIGVRLKNGQSVGVSRKDVTDMALPLGRDYDTASGGKSYGHAVMNPERFDKSGNFISKNSSTNELPTSFPKKLDEVKPTAKFAHHQEDELAEGGAIAMYDVEGGPYHKSTKSQKELDKLGIGIEGDTPPFTGKPEVPPAIRQMLLKSGISEDEINAMPVDDAIRKGQEIFRGGQMDPKKPVPIKPETESVRNPVESIEKLKLALREASQNRPVQEHMRGIERSRRAASIESVTTSGMAGHFEKLGRLKGELPSVGITNKLEQADVDSLMDGVTNSELMPYQKINAGSGLMKLLNGEMVTPYESKLLTKVYGDDIEELIQLHGGIGFSGASRKVISDVVNLPRTIMSSFDFSAALRQGLPLIHKKEYWKNFSQMFKYAGDEQVFKSSMEALEARPKFHLGEQAGLYLADIGKHLGKREEQFLSGLVDKFPGFGGSQRAYTGFLNKLRADVYDDLVDKAIAMGHQMEDIKMVGGVEIKTPTKMAKELADYVNNASGRGDLGSLAKNADLVNGLFFSPSLMASRFRLLNPFYYFDSNVSAMARKESLKSLLAVAGAGTVMSGLMSQAGADVSLDPTSSDFGKARFGNVRVDPFGGFQQYVVGATRLVTGRATTTAGKTHDLWNSKFPNPTYKSVVGDFFENKTSPVMSFAITLSEGEQAFKPAGIGKVTSEAFGSNMKSNRGRISAEVINRFVPMIVNDLTDIYNEDPSLLPLGLGAALGMGVQTHKQQKPKSPFRMNLSIGAP